MANFVTSRSHNLDPLSLSFCPAVRSDNIPFGGKVATHLESTSSICYRQITVDPEFALFEKAAQVVQSSLLCRFSVRYRQSARFLECNCPELAELAHTHLKMGHPEFQITHKQLFLESFKILRLMVKQYYPELKGELKGEKFLESVNTDTVPSPADLVKALKIYSFLKDYNLLILRSGHSFNSKYNGYKPKHQIITVYNLHDEANAFRKYLQDNAEFVAKAVEGFNLQHKNMTLIPSEIGYFRGLEEFVVSHNPISLVSSEIKKLSSLKIFCLSCSNLRTFSLDMFDHQLYVINVSGPGYAPLIQ